MTLKTTLARRLTKTAFSLGLSSLACSTVLFGASPIAKSMPSKEAKWDLIVSAKTNDIVSAIHHFSSQPDFLSDGTSVGFCERAFNVLSLRKHSPAEREHILRLREKSKIDQNFCVLKGCYIAESAGILKRAIDKKAKPHEVVHVYGCATKRLFHKWQKVRKNTPFEQYLKRNASRKQLKQMRRSILDYHAHELRESYRVSFKDGLAYYKNAPMHGRYIYVLDATGTALYAGVKQAGKIQHSTFLSGDPVQCAGWIFMENGVIIRANLSSGHYKPDNLAAERLRKFLLQPEILGEKAKDVAITLHYR